MISKSLKKPIQSLTDPRVQCRRYRAALHCGRHRGRRADTGSTSDTPRTVADDVPESFDRPRESHPNVSPRVNLFEGRIRPFPSPFLIFLRRKWPKKPQTFPGFNLF